MDEATTGTRAWLREAARASVREQVADRALTLFDERGFDSVTVHQLADAIGISPRSFFRYFPSKEDVVIGDPEPFGEIVRSAAAQRPADESVWTVLRRSFDPIVELTERPAYQARGLRSIRVTMSTASLRARNYEKHLSWAAMLEPVILDRMEGVRDSRLFRARALILSALSCLDAALAEWTLCEGAVPLHTLLDDAFATVHSAHGRDGDA
ncbi:TetR family transcriptional regulator [Gordonia sp. KTR9]|uniref:TetR family transcriptional regulator n=1 Tax=Gordonia sp. KTR9 TaxID=337191 RepID=UPI00027DDBB0|nr:TetR family transcriptional regulator [Gordonia sp. KTR9]AFR48163.1 Transcriptional regulator [Gordonia sp. KTR9]